jgi:hypothetical protein
MLAVVATFAGANFPALAAEFPDPIGPAASGQMQCYMPDAAKKTCNSLAGYRSNANGGIDNFATVLLSKNPVLTMQTVSPVEIRMGQVCGKIRKQDIDTAKFTLNGRPVDEQQAGQLRGQLLMAFQNVFDHDVCTGYVNQGGALIAKAVIDGVPAPANADQQVMWVAPSDGYQVGP